jgi:hypothetical protein
MINEDSAKAKKWSEWTLTERVLMWAAFGSLPWAVALLVMS